MNEMPQGFLMSLARNTDAMARFAALPDLNKEAVLEATVKRYFKESGHFRLQPENAAMKPIIVNELTILGKVVSVYRSL